MLRKRARSNQKIHQEMGSQITTSDGPKTTKSQPDNIISGGGQGQKPSSLFNVPGLLVGLAPRCVLDYDLVKSPKSPLDFKIFSSLSSSFRFPTKSSSNNNHESHQKCWESDKVGLGILDSLGDDGGDSGGAGDDTNSGGGGGVNNTNGKAVKPSNSKNILLGPQIRTKTTTPNTTTTTPSSPHFNNICTSESPKSLPPKDNNPILPQKQAIQKGKSDVFFEIVEDPLDPTYTCRKTQSFSLDSNRIGSSYIHRVADNNTKKSSRLANGSVEQLLVAAATAPATKGSNSNKSLGSLSASEIELSEDYTCVITRGPNPKTTHIFGDCILESHTNGSSARIDSGKPKAVVESVEFDGIPPAVDEKSSSLVEFFFQPSSFPSTEFLSFCHFCHKKLEEGKDIYMYRGEKAFCSSECRQEEILIEEEKEKSATEEAPMNESPPLVW